MHDCLIKIQEYRLKKNPKIKSHFYRHQKLLLSKCSHLKHFHFVRTAHEESLLKILATSAPLLETDFENMEWKLIFRKWSKLFPSDRKFYSMALKQYELWKTFSEKTLLEFLSSEAGQNWFALRKRLKRRALFELDIPYKQSKEAALSYELQIRNLIRSNPLITYADLTALGVRNAQKIYESFPQREFLRKTHLQKIKIEFEIS